VKFALATLAASIVLMGCQEKLTSPGDCPALCPGGEPQVFDEIFTPITGADSSFRGYIQPFAAPALLASNGLQGNEERAVIRFVRRVDSVAVRDTMRAYTIDSVAFGLFIVARDTTLTGVQLQLYRLPTTIDSTTTFADVDPSFVPGNLVATVPIPDSVKTGAIRTVLQGPALAGVQIPAADTGILALGIRIDSPTPTGVRLGSINGGAGAAFVTYVTLDVPDTGTAKLRNLGLNPAFNSFLSAAPVVDDSALIAVGGSPSARALLRFDLPARILDSATVVRATLELTPVAPITGLPTDSARLQARAVLADLGAKSPVNSSVGRVPAVALESGFSDTVRLEAVRVVELWLGASTSPSALVLSLAPELDGASFSQPVFYSTRAADPNVRPRLRISYLRSFPFENP
jgi:hypothetical protein